MPSTNRFRDLGEAFISKDRMENFVRYCLVQNPGIFRNHLKQKLPRMVATIPGQYNNQGYGKGIDVFALDGLRQLWLIEISRGSKKGAALEKELPNRVYAGNKAQMSPEWRRAAADKFLREAADATKKLQALFDVPGLDRERLDQLFEDRFKSHRAAVLVPAGTHVAVKQTGLKFATHIYTFNYPCFEDEDRQARWQSSELTYVSVRPTDPFDRL